MQESIKFTNFYLSAIQEKHSEVLIKTAATISCVVTGLTKQLDSVTWEKPNSGGKITHGTEGYRIDNGTYQILSQLICFQNGRHFQDVQHII